MSASNKIKGQQHTITEHNKQLKSRAMQSHHPESQTALKAAVANYSSGKDKTLLMPEKQHQKTFKPQTAHGRWRAHSSFRSLASD
jgi:hypothetical protein